MKTTLPVSINTVGEAKAFLAELYTNGESFHPEDDAHDILWNEVEVSPAEADQLNALMSMIYELPECTPKHDGEIGLYMDFDPCGYILDIHNADDEQE